MNFPFIKITPRKAINMGMVTNFYRTTNTNEIVFHFAGTSSEIIKFDNEEDCKNMFDKITKNFAINND